MSKIMKIYFVMILFIFSTGISVSQLPNKGSTGTVTKTSVINFSELAKKGQSEVKEKENTLLKSSPRNPIHKVPPKYLITQPRGVDGLNKGNDKDINDKMLVPSPGPSASFIADPDPHTWIPPDVMGAVSANYLMITLNSAVVVQDRSGNVLSSVTLQNFWSGYYSNYVFDPNIVYDPFAERWYFVAVSDAGAATNSVLVAVSQTNNPLGGWYLTAIDADAGNTTWADYPRIGFNKNWIAISVNMFDNGTNYYSGLSKIYAISRPGAALGAWSFTTFNAAWGFTMVPSVTYDLNYNTIHFVEAWDYGVLRLSTLTGNIGSEVLTEGSGWINTQTMWDFVGAGFPNNAPQLGGACNITTNDARMATLVYRNGTLFACHSVFPFGTPRGSIEWYEYKPDGTVLQDGLIDDPSGTVWYAFPSLSVNAKNEVLIAYSRFSPTTYASAAYSYRSPLDPVSTLRDPYILKQGEASYCKDYGSGRNRWGDYTTTMIDPVNDLDMWTIGEYAAMPWGGQDSWGTWWGKVNSQNPYTQDRNISFMDISSTSFGINWIRGNGQGSLMLIKQGSPIYSDEFPLPGTTFLSYNNNFSSAPGFGSSKVIYYGTSSSLKVTGLNALQWYYVRIFGYNGSPSLGSATYFLSSANQNPVRQRSARFKGPDNIEYVNDLSGSISLSAIRPNPVKDKLIFDIYSENQRNYSIEIFDLNGQILETMTGVALLGTKEISLSTSQFPSGTYLLKIQSDDEIAFTTFVIVK